jgi:competence protein ComEC
MWTPIKISKKQLRSALATALLIGLYSLSEFFSTGRGLNSDEVVVWVFDVGQGDAIFINAPGKQLLIDGGPDDLVLEKLSAVLPFWDRSIDLIVNTHPHADHVQGLVSVLERYEVGEVWISPASYSTGEYLEFLNDFTGEAVPPVGETIELGGGAQLRVIYLPAVPPSTKFADPNDASIVLELIDGETTMLFTGDAGIEQEVEFLSSLGHVDILKVGHHGSDTSTSRELLEKITPDVGIISVGENDYGHPDPLLIDRLRHAQVETLQTKIDGDIRIRTTGSEPEIAVLHL